MPEGSAGPSPAMAKLRPASPQTGRCPTEPGMSSKTKCSLQDQRRADGYILDRSGESVMEIPGKLIFQFP